MGPIVCATRGGEASRRTQERAIALARETAYQVRILAGTNQRIAVRRQLGDAAAFRRAGKW